MRKIICPPQPTQLVFSDSLPLSGSERLPISFSYQSLVNFSTFTPFATLTAHVFGTVLAFGGLLMTWRVRVGSEFDVVEGDIVHTARIIGQTSFVSSGSFENIYSGLQVVKLTYETNTDAAINRLDDFGIYFTES